MLLFKGMPFTKRRTYRRSYRDRLTGGTRDVNPQLFNGIYEQDTADTTVTKTINLPVNPVSQAGRASTVIEILKVIWHIKPLPFISDAAQQADTHWGALTTRDHGATALEGGESDIISFCEFAQKGAFTALGTYAMFEICQWENDLTDGAGHGVIVATPQLYVQVGSTLQNDHGVDIGLQILYRFKNVGLTEYIGVVTAQLAGNA